MHTRHQVALARRMLAALTVAGRAPMTGYDREGKFGAAWADVNQNGCDTRDDVLARDLTRIRMRDACTVVAGRLADLYTGRAMRFSKSDAIAVQIDHVFPLGLAWQLGAQSWPAGKRVTFANDPANLLTVDGASNEQKSDSGPDSWLPPNKGYRCTYVIRFTRVAYAYHLRVTPSMRAAIARQLATCRHVFGSPATLRTLPRAEWAHAASYAGGTTSGVGGKGFAGASRRGEAAPVGDSCPPSYPVKGNISSSGHIYHLPGDPWYAETNPEACFATAADARAAGFRAPR